MAKHKTKYTKYGLNTGSKYLLGTDGRNANDSKGNCKDILFSQNTFNTTYMSWYNVLSLKR